jgi:hypothetical protein
MNLPLDIDHFGFSLDIQMSKFMERLQRRIGIRVAPCLSSLLETFAALDLVDQLIMLRAELSFHR